MENFMSDKITLWGITEELKVLDTLLEMDNGEIGEDLDQLINDVAELMSKKTDSVVGYIKREEDLISLASAKIKELQDYKKAKTNKIQKFKEYVKECLERTGKEKFVGTINAIKLRKPAKVVNILDEDKIPLIYMTEKTTYTIDKKLIGEAIKNGEEVCGAVYVDGKVSIAIGLNKGK